MANSSSKSYSENIVAALVQSLIKGIKPKPKKWLILLLLTIFSAYKLSELLLTDSIKNDIVHFFWTDSTRVTDQMGLPKLRILSPKPLQMVGGAITVTVDNPFSDRVVCLWVLDPNGGWHFQESIRQFTTGTATQTIFLGNSLSAHHEPYTILAYACPANSIPNQFPEQLDSHFTDQLQVYLE